MDLNGEKSPLTLKNFLSVLGIALALRLAIFFYLLFHPQGTFYGDSKDYYYLAQNLIQHHVFSRQAFPPLVIDAIYPPGYVLFLTNLFVIFGYRIWVVTLVQIVLTTAILYLIYHLGKQFLGTGPAILAGFIWAIDLESIFYVNILAPDTLLTLSLLLFLYFFVKLNMNLRFAFAAGLMLGIAAIIKPIALYLPVFAILMLWFWRKAHLTGTSTCANFWRPAILIIVAFSLIVFPWFLRNRVVFGKWKFTALQGKNLLFYNVASLESNLRGITFHQANDSLQVELDARYPNLAKMNPMEISTIYEKLAVKKIFQHPFRYAVLHSRGIVTTLIDPGRIDINNVFQFNNPSQGFLEVISCASLPELLRFIRQFPTMQLFLFLGYGGFLLTITFFLFYGIAVLCHQRNFVPLIIFGIPLFYFLLIIGPIGAARFRNPIMPNIALLAALGCYSLKQKFQEFKKE